MKIYYLYLFNLIIKFESKAVLASLYSSKINKRHPIIIPCYLLFTLLSFTILNFRFLDYLNRFILSAHSFEFLLFIL